MRELRRALTSMLFLAVICGCQMPTASTPQTGIPQPLPPDMRAWTEHEVPGAMGGSGWTDIASSADGTRLAAVASPSGYIWTSTDAGATWTSQTSIGRRSWTSITSSADGTRLAAVGASPIRDYPYSVRYIYTSTDSGATWTERTSAGSRVWQDITSSADGTKLAAVVFTTKDNYPFVSPPGYIYTSTDGGVSWTERTSAGSRNWESITSSADGTKLAALVYPDRDSVGNILDAGYIYTSTDSGATWTEQILVWHWYGITGSADGTKLAAVSNGSIHVSTDSGATWIYRESSSSRYWSSIAVSADGTTFAATVEDGYIYTSTDDGVTWAEQTSAGCRAWGPITSSADGSKLAASGGGYIYTSTDSGITWTERTSAGSRAWSSIASSADGSKLAAAVKGGYIYTSTDSGVTWTERTSAGARVWSSITSSADGTKLAAAVRDYGWDHPSYIYTSTDSGVTWTERTSAGSRAWSGITNSADGSKLAAAVYGGYIYTSADSGVTWTQNTSAWGNIVTISADGTRLAVLGWGSYNSYVYTSADSGATWTQHIFKGSWTGRGSITSSADGTKLAALVSFPRPDISYPDFAATCICTSSDGGTHWTRRTEPMSSDWTCITSSADGTKLAAALANDCVYTSADSGATWAPCACSGSRHWSSVTSSADGTKLAAVSDWDNSIFTSP